MSNTREHAKQQESEQELSEVTAESETLGSVVERILLSQPLNPLRKCEFEVMPRSVS